MDAKAVKASMKELENAGDADRVFEVLSTLNEQFKPSEQLLRETKIGVAVNKLRSHSDPRVSSLVKKMVATWREKVQLQKQQAQLKRQQTTESAKPAVKRDPQTPGKRDWKSDNVNTQVYTDQVRNNCIQVTYNALAVQSTKPSADILKAAKEVEQAVFTFEKGTTPGYRNKMRSLFVNLKDPKNPMLREHVVDGKISGERLREMKPQEMANDELKRQMEEIEKKNLFNAQSAQEQRSVTDRFTCGKCKQKKVSYYQMQTRSADEPLTTFCTCENCNNRWKFS